MTDDPKPTDRFGDEIEPPATSPLLFVGGADDDDEDAGEAGGWRDDGYDPVAAAAPAQKRNGGPIVVGLLLVVLVAGVVGVALSGDDPDDEPEIRLPAEPPPMSQGDIHIAPFPSGDLTGAVRTTLPVGVRVTYATGGAVQDTVVHYEIESGEGELSVVEARTSREGIAISRLTLPDRPGTTVVRARLRASGTAYARVLASALPGAAATFTATGGQGQEGFVGDLLPNRVRVRMLDGDGNPLSNARVEFNVLTGAGVVAPTRTRTDSLGYASARWRLGIDEGEQQLEVSSQDLRSSALMVTANALPRATLEPIETRIETREVVVTPRTYAVGVGHVCELVSGTIRCRGGATRGQTSGDGASGFVFVTAGASHTCGLDSSGQATCWGANESGQLGDGTTQDRAAGVQIRTDLRFSVITGGTSHTCGLAGGGVPVCWGRNLSGQLGDGTRNDTALPRMVGGGMEFVDLVAGWNHTCGLTSNGNTFCWGQNQAGQVGDGSRLDQLEPKLARGSVETLVAGSSHTCGISQGEVLCWGGNSQGQLGTGDADDRLSPAAVTGLPGRPTDLAAGAVHTCALVDGGRVFCWGQNRSGQLGSGTTQGTNQPVEVSGGQRFVSISAGGAQTCGRTADGADYCWGLNQGGQLGDGTRTSRSEPTRVQR
ncbi:MAG: hypothetical protein AAF389_08015 [Gemmatimonadota bacterium]